MFYFCMLYISVKMFISDQGTEEVLGYYFAPILFFEDLVIKLRTLVAADHKMC